MARAYGQSVDKCPPKWLLAAVLLVACGGKAADDSSVGADGGGKDASFADALDDAIEDAPIGDGACPTPASIDAFAPTPMQPPRVSKGACTSAQIDEAFKACFTPSTGCDAFKANDPTCAACLFSRDTDATWGPAVAADAGIAFNASGCVAAITGDSSETSCAQRLDDVGQCLSAACEAQCIVSDQATLAELQQCYGNAGKSVCSGYVADECAFDAGWSTTCIGAGSNNPEADFDSIAGVMCGP